MPTDPPPQIEADYVDYNPDTETYHTRFDVERGPDAVIVAVVETVGAATDREPTDIPPLYRTINPGALGELISPPRDESVDVAFKHDGVRVRVSSRGTVVARLDD